MQEKEIWKPIKGYEGFYEVSNFGNIKSLNYNKTGKQRLLTTRDNGRGYVYVVLSKEGIHRNKYVHRLVAESFVENTRKGIAKEVNHKDECTSNNYYKNLEWVTRKENNIYGTRLEKVAKARSKIVVQYDKNGNLIREWKSACEIQRVLGFSQGHISNCCLCKTKSAYGYKWVYK